MLIFNRFKGFIGSLFFIFSFLFIANNICEANMDIDEKFLMATFEGDISGVKTLIKQGADINYKDSKLFFNSDKMRITSLSPSAYTALMIASCYGHIEIVKYLVDNGTSVRKAADIDFKTQDGNTALTYALMYRHTEILKFLEDKGADINIDVKQFRMLLVATTWGDLEVVKYLIENGADVNYKDPHYPYAKGMRITSADSYDYTALMIASRYGHLDIVKYLIDSGTSVRKAADINIKTNNSSTALMFASMYEHAEIEKFLIDNGADINIKNRYGIDY